MGEKEKGKKHHAKEAEGSDLRAGEARAYNLVRAREEQPHKGPV